MPYMAALAPRTAFLGYHAFDATHDEKDSDKDKEPVFAPAETVVRDSGHNAHACLFPIGSGFHFTLLFIAIWQPTARCPLHTEPFPRRALSIETTGRYPAVTIGVKGPINRLGAWE